MKLIFFNKNYCLAMNSSMFEKLEDNKEAYRHLTKTTSFGVYTRSIFKTSLITSFPQIARSKNIKKILWKLLIFFVCLEGFVYHTWHYLLLYFSYPTTVFVETIHLFNVVQPAVTFCSNNLLRRHVYCERNDSTCKFTQNVSQFCQKYPKYCTDNRENYYGIPSYEDSLNALSLRSWEMADEGAPENMFWNCSIIVEGENIGCSGIRRFPIVTNAGSPTFCYTINSHINQPYEKDVTYPNTFYYYFEVLTFPEEYFYYTDPVLMYAAIHSPKHIVNPFREGIKMKAGCMYEAYVSAVENVRLPYPYNTNCTDYIKLWRKNNGTGPLDQTSCIQHCKLNKLRLKGLCIDKHTTYVPHRDELCDDNYDSTTNEMIKDCALDCQQACRELKYKVESDETALAKRLREFCCLKSIFSKV